ncbi:MAG: ATP-binding cassette domain-containing protein [Gammaproteobacteria bacterium]
MSDDILVNASHVSRYYGDRRAVDDISFNIKRGEIAAFLGPNGAGKSTLMQMLCGVLAATSGTIEIAGYDILEQPLQAKRHLGYLPEQPPLYTDCTVDEYLFYCARIRGIRGSDVARAVTTCKEQCGLSDTGKRLIGNLSKGYQQRVGIAQAIIHTPPVIVLDEPGSGLDPSQIIEIRELIRGMRENHGIILSTHILSEAESICDRVLLVSRGKLVLDKGIPEFSAGTDSLEQVYLQLTRQTAAGTENNNHV